MAGFANDELHSLDTASLLWMRRSGEAAPAARFGHGFVAAGDSLFVCDGSDASGELL
jgi:hypothetical protein